MQVATLIEHFDETHAQLHHDRVLERVQHQEFFYPLASEELVTLRPKAIDRGPKLGAADVA
jgi:hypothetical protein